MSEESSIFLNDIDQLVTQLSSDCKGNIADARSALTAWAKSRPHDVVPEYCIALIRSLCAPVLGHRRWQERFRFQSWGHLLQQLLQCKTDWTPRTVRQILEAAAQLQRPDHISVHLPVGSIIQWLERQRVAGFLTAAVRESLARFRQIDELLHDERESATTMGSDAFGETVAEDLKGMPDDIRSHWHELLQHCFALKTTQPTNRWLVEAGKKLTEIGDAQDTATRVSHWLGSAGSRAAIARTGYGGHLLDATLIDPNNGTCMRGLVFCLAKLRPDAETARQLGDLAEICFRKVPGYGPRCPVVGRACVSVLSSMDEREAIAQLGRLEQRVRHASTRAAVSKGFSQVSSRANLSKDDLLEISIPTGGLGSERTLRQTIGEYVATLDVKGGNACLQFQNKAGNIVKALPTSIAKTHRDEVKSVKSVVKAIDQTIRMVREHFDAMLMRERQWALADWRTRFLDHPLASTVVSRLLWVAIRPGSEPTSFMPRGRSFEDVHGQKIELKANDNIRLWHPATCDSREVREWRHRLEHVQIVQPFKQAHREIYLLTDAERDTRTYSNRFAAHILRQHQFRELCRQRGWAYDLQGAFDSHNVPRRRLREYGLIAEFWVEPIEEAEQGESGIYRFVSTDQVRFHHERGGEPLPLDQIPPLVFSEVMRDVDLFVGVASVGNDPTWQDGGPEGRYRDYWQSYSFGELAETAKTRRAVLEGLLPRLSKIRERCSLEERFLIVRGDLRTYKIHLGSANILMRPNDEYLCIVPDRSSRGGNDVFLPFEGDGTLAIILSKAFLLADDAKIKDPTITRQITAH